MTEVAEDDDIPDDVIATLSDYSRRHAPRERARRRRQEARHRRAVEARTHRAATDARRAVDAEEGARARDIRSGRHVDDPPALGRPLLRAAHVRRSRPVRRHPRGRARDARRDRRGHASSQRGRSGGNKAGGERPHPQLKLDDRICTAWSCARSSLQLRCSRRRATRRTRRRVSRARKTAAAEQASTCSAANTCVVPGGAGGDGPVYDAEIIDDAAGQQVRRADPRRAAAVRTVERRRRFGAYHGSSVTISVDTTIDTHAGSITPPVGPVAFQQTPTHAVFGFTALDVKPGVKLTLVGDRAAVFVVLGDAMIGGTIDGSGGCSSDVPIRRAPVRAAASARSRRSRPAAARPGSPRPDARARRQQRCRRRRWQRRRHRRRQGRRRRLGDRRRGRHRMPDRGARAARRRQRRHRRRHRA